MTDEVDIGFEKKRITLEIAAIHPVKMVSPSVKNTKKYKQIFISVQELGIIEPLIVHPQKGSKKKYILLDGHLRLEVLKDLGKIDAACLIARDDEAFTYNKRISRLASVQEHYMILGAIENGVLEERIAKVLGVNVARIRQKKKLLEGICPEAVEVLKDRHFPTGTINVMKRIKPKRQIDMAELMVAANNYSISYARALLLATPNDQLKEPDKKKPVGDIGEEERNRMELEIENLRRNMKSVEEDYGTNVVRLVVSNGYVLRLLDNQHIAKYLGRHQSDLLEQLQHITESISADSGTAPQGDPPR